MIKERWGVKSKPVGTAARGLVNGVLGWCTSQWESEVFQKWQSGPEVVKKEQEGPLHFRPYDMQDLGGK